MAFKEQSREARNERDTAIEENAEGVHIGVRDETLC